MDILNTSAITNSSESTETSLGFVSCTDNEVSFNSDVWEITKEEIEAMSDVEDPPLLLEIASLPTNPTVSNESFSSTASSFVTPPEVVEVKCRRTRHRRKKSHQHSSPYAQLCFDPNQKTLVTMLEIDVVNGRKKRHSRLPLDAPSPEDYFPWLHRNDEEGDDIPGLTSSSWSFSCSSGSSCISGLTESKDDPGTTTDRNDGYNEPIILSGWMMDTDSMSDEEADIYWLLHEGEDVWVKIDDGCAKALRKMLSCCGHWKIKRSSTPPQPQDTQDAREEKRFRYSILH